jgi:hypothetical protein
MKLEAATVEEYVRAAGPRGPDLMGIDRIIAAIAPDLRRRLYSGPSITMIGYGEMSWERPTGSGVWPLIGVAAQKHHISIYVAAEKEGLTLADHYRERLGKTNNGKNCIRFRRLADVDEAQLANAVRDAMAWAELQEKSYGRNCAIPVE